MQFLAEDDAFWVVVYGAGHFLDAVEEVVVDAGGQGGVLFWGEAADEVQGVAGKSVEFHGAAQGGGVLAA